MRCAFINLDAATERRARLEANFHDVAPPGLMLERVAAIPAAEAARLPGRIASPEKGCFQSHLKALSEHHDGASHLMVLEDDVILTPAAFGAPERPGDGWDLLFLDVVVADVGLWSALEVQRRQLDGRTRILDLSTFPFAGAAAYIVNGRSKARVSDALRGASMDLPYDIVLQKLVHSGALRACLMFPFLTTVAGSADTSQIRPAHDLDGLSNAFRRRIFDGVGDGRSAEELTSAAVALLGSAPV